MTDDAQPGGVDGDQPDTARIELDAILHATADPLRRHMLALLAEHGEMTAAEMALPVSRATGSYHCRILRQAGWTHTRVRGRERYLSLRRADLDGLYPGLVEAVLAAELAERERPKH
ncbi:ArsR family transcriptional regulator [Nocardia panacis]|uniref:ArsR family transcriptional regulator n=1 Tax=Nocardia panacis TaxID=2340916 RepID=A0A3A4JVX8_9NOCA|nr:helix-turn-helix domain-containing protein [Nocardia panacis]RJO70752.1 ArsR family transcriptional regulator [Nocardia panacis]